MGNRHSDQQQHHRPTSAAASSSLSAPKVDPRKISSSSAMAGYPSSSASNTPRSPILSSRSEKLVEKQSSDTPTTKAKNKKFSISETSLPSVDSLNHRQTSRRHFNFQKSSSSSASDQKSLQLSDSEKTYLRDSWSELMRNHENFVHDVWTAALDRSPSIKATFLQYARRHRTRSLVDRTRSASSDPAASSSIRTSGDQSTQPSIIIDPSIKSTDQIELTIDPSTTSSNREPRSTIVDHHAYEIDAADRARFEKLTKTIRDFFDQLIRRDRLEPESMRVSCRALGQRHRSYSQHGYQPVFFDIFIVCFLDRIESIREETLKCKILRRKNDGINNSTTTTHKQSGEQAVDDYWKVMTNSSAIDDGEDDEDGGGGNDDIEKAEAKNKKTMIAWQKLMRTIVDLMRDGYMKADRDPSPMPPPVSPPIDIGVSESP